MSFSEKVIRDILSQVSKQKLSPQTAFEKLRHLSYESLNFARIDHHRICRTHMPEVVYAPGKTDAQLEKIIGTLFRQKTLLLISRLEEKSYLKLKKKFPRLVYSKIAKLAHAGTVDVHGKNDARVAVVTAGTSDIPVAEEAAVTLEVLGCRVDRFYDCGVAGLHRLLDQLPDIEKARAIICIAGMEGALPSVLAGLVSSPVIAVPTSVGYGSSFKGVAPLLTMLNSCSQGIAVVNIDSGFNAACFAYLILCPATGQGRIKSDDIKHERR